MSTIRFTESSLEKVGVTIVDPYKIFLQCKHCNYVWAPIIKTGGRFPRCWWKCPEGCNA